jgi:hypothetical protein
LRRHSHRFAETSAKVNQTNFYAMKKLWTATLFTTAIFGHIASAQNCTPNQVLLQNYNNEIASMAVDYMFATGQQDTDQIQVPVQHYNFVAEGMAAIFNASFPERDSIFDIFCVHGFAGANNYLNKVEMIVFFDTTYAWTEAWKQGGSTPTGNAAIDALLTNNDFTAHDYTGYPSFPPGYQHRVLISGEQVFNIDAAIDALMAIPGITFAEPNGWIGGAGELNLNILGSNRVFTFEHEWSDCFDGCDEFINWSIRVDANCVPTYYARSQGAAFDATQPPAPNCNITTDTKTPPSAEPTVRLMPNPVREQITIDFGDNRSSSDFVITNLLGQTVLEGRLDASTASIDVSRLRSGVYWVTIPGVARGLRFVKE